MSSVSSVIEKFFKEYVSFKSIKEVVEEIDQERQKLNALPLEKRDRQIIGIAREIRNNLFEVDHPIVKSKIEWGNIKGTTKEAKELEQVIVNLLKKGITSTEDVKSLEEKIKKFEERVKRELGRKLFEEKDLRQLPGSVALTEASNLYFGEKYTEQGVQQAGTWLLESICLGRFIAIYFIDESLRQSIRRILLRSFGSKHIDVKNLGNLKVHRVEQDKPHIILVKFLLWLHDELLAENEEVREALELLKRGEGVILSMPDKAKESVIHLPRLDLFFSRWLEVSELRKILRSMRDQLYSFMGNVERGAKRAGKQKAAENELELLATYCEIFYADLLKSGFVNQGSLRRIVDLVIEISEKYRVGTTLFFVGGLTS